MHLKITIFFCLMGIAFPVFCQEKVNLNFLENSQFKWSDFELSYPDSLKRNLIRELNNSLTTDPLKDYISDNNSDYHLMDVDANGEVDIIYYGFAGKEKNHTLVFLRSGNRFSKKLDAHGEIIGIERRFPFSPVTFKLMNSPCCEDIDFSYEEYSYSFKKNELFYQLSYQLKFVRGTIFPACEVSSPRYNHKPPMSIIFTVNSFTKSNSLCPLCIYCDNIGTDVIYPGRAS